MSVKEAPLGNIADSPFVMRASDLATLLKPRVMALAVFTAFVGQVAAPGVVEPISGLASIVAIAMGAGAAGALNMWYDADLDALMSRTRRRPLPDGRLDRRTALVLGLFLGCLAVVMLGAAAGGLAAALLAFTIFFYVVVYTAWLKRSTPQNIVIGGAAGALPPVIGWTATTGTFDLESLVLFLIIFLWTPPHFWALALFKSGDYGAANIPMMPNVAGEASTRRQIFVYALLLAPASILPWVVGMAGLLYAGVAGLLSLGLLLHAWKLLDAGSGERQPARKLFSYSILYLFAIFAILLLDVIVARVSA